MADVYFFVYNKMIVPTYMNRIVIIYVHNVLQFKNRLYPDFLQ